MLENNLILSQKCKHISSIQPSHPTPRYLQQNEGTHLYKGMLTAAQRSFIFNSPKLEATQMSIHIVMNKLRYIHTMDHNSTIKKERNKL